MSLPTPEKIRDFQKKLYVKAKTEPKFRFYSLYDKIHRQDILRLAYELAKANGGAPGVDGICFEAIEASGLESWLQRLEEDLRTNRYKPDAVRRVYIPKAGGGERPLGIPTIRDRVAQTAAKIVIEPIFEADFPDEMYGYRPERSAQDAVKEVHDALRQGYTEVVDADLSKYFDTIPHADLIQSVARRISDGKVLHLLKLWIKAPVEEKDEKGNPRRTGGRDHDQGTPQGGVISPLLANIYMRRFVQTWKERGMGEALQAKVVNYADDFVILSRGYAEEALGVTRRWMEKLKLALNEKKTCLRNAREETFDFLGYTFGPIVDRRTGTRYLGAKPSKKALTKLRERLRDVLNPRNSGTWQEIVLRVNRMTRGWANYFCFGTLTVAYRHVQWYLAQRARDFLARRHKVRGRATSAFPDGWLFGRDNLVAPLVTLRARRSKA